MGESPENQLNVFGRKIVFWEIRELILPSKKPFFLKTLWFSVFSSPPEVDLDNHKYLDNEVLIFTPLYNTENGLYRGLKKRLSNIILRGDLNETFFSYGFDKERSKVLYCTVKQPLPNIFQCTAFKKHIQYLLNQNQEKSCCSKMFLYLPSTLDHKEELNQWSEHVNLHPIDVSYEQLRALNGNQDFQPEGLDYSSKRNKITKIFYSFMKEAAPRLIII